jgi:hypothetical protein
MCRLSRNPGTSWNPKGLSRPVMGLLYLYERLCRSQMLRKMYLYVGSFRMSRGRVKNTVAAINS